MTDEAFVFTDTARERKQMAIGSKHKKSGRVSHKVGLSQDHMSEAELRKKNGEVKAYNMFVPWTWKEFKSAPADICQMYLDRLYECYHLNIAALSKMFDKSKTAIRDQMKAKGVTLMCKPGHMYMDDAKEFEEFLSRVPVTEEYVPCKQPSEPVLVPVEQKHDDAPDALASCLDTIRKAFGLNDEEAVEEEPPAPSMKRCTFLFEGLYNEDYILKILNNSGLSLEKRYVIRIEVKESE